MWMKLGGVKTGGGCQNTSQKMGGSALPPTYLPTQEVGRSGGSAIQFSKMSQTGEEDTKFYDLAF